MAESGLSISIKGGNPKVLRLVQSIPFKVLVYQLKVVRNDEEIQGQYINMHLGARKIFHNSVFCEYIRVPKWCYYSFQYCIQGKS